MGQYAGKRVGQQAGTRIWSLAYRISWMFSASLLVSAVETRVFFSLFVRPVSLTQKVSKARLKPIIYYLSCPHQIRIPCLMHVQNLLRLL